MGRPRGRGRWARGMITNTSRKRAYGIRIIDMDDSTALNKRRQLIDEDSDAISRSPAGSHESLNLELSGVGVPLDSSFARKSGGFMLLWRKDLNVTLQSFSPHHIDITVAEVGNDSWRFTKFYGHPEVAKSKESWNLLRKLSKQSVRPWLCTGDFNEIISKEEKQGQLVHPEWQVEAFR
ncbi:UNVERIFIED_CONTAM: hypothetical protein Sradi_0741400 [Sesamum radiatum]|uniref:Endonuclease/exonuclease/phosphatase n=1 Tax=Sesamum radiatum TaxID=300843 RepID=A0AAW2VN08_SESRA